jgi:uncharacterized membrane protein YdbT with pleckstrin-like domain
MLFWFQLPLLIIIGILIILLKTSFVGIAVLVVLLVIVTYSLLALMKTSYAMDDDMIAVQNVFKKIEIPYDTVKKITNTNRYFANLDVFVLSMDRIEIAFGESDGKVSISPRGKEDILAALREKCPDAEYEEAVKARKDYKIVEGRLVPPSE